MSAMEITIRHEDDGGEVWLEVKRDDADSLFVILDAQAADLLESILRIRRCGTYDFGPLDLNG